MDKDILSVISESAGSFSKGQKKIANYILDNYDKAAFMTASRLGEVVGVSESTVVRFAADLGYDGYPSMRKAIQEMIKNCLTTVQRIEVSRDMMETSDIVETVLSSDIYKIRTTLEGIDQESFDQALDAIVGAKKIYVFGLRSSAALATFMGFYLNMLFPNVNIINGSSPSEVFEQILRIDEGDLLIALCFPRYSHRTIKAMRFSRDKGAKVLGITDSETSIVAQLADIKLYAKSEMVSFLDSLVAPLSLINALIVAAANRSHGDLLSNFEKLEEIWAEYGVYEKNEH